MGFVIYYNCLEIINMRSLLKKTVRNGIYVCIITFTLLYLIMVLKVNKIASYAKGAKSHIQMIQWTNNTRNHTNSKQSALVRIKLIDVFESKYNNNLQHSNNRTKQGFNFIQDNGETNHVTTLGTDVRGEDYFKSWNDKVERLCDNQISVYDQTVLVFNNITVFPELSAVHVNPGEDLENGGEEKEVFQLRKGFFSMNCSTPVHRLHRGGGRHVHGSWEAAFDYNIKPSMWSPRFEYSQVEELTVALVRIEYANVYWTLIDLYDVFLTSVFLNQSAANTHVLLLDARPQGHLDALWDIYKTSKRPSDLRGPTVYNRLSWLFARAKSPILTRSLKPFPFIKQFREFVLNSEQISTGGSYTRDCDNLNVLFLWRRNYVAHPRNPSGKISRKIKNEEELLRVTRSTFPAYNIRGEQLDLYNVTTQLRIISKMDIFIGMHGAGLAYSMFLPPHSVVIELFPAYYKGMNWHMEFIARRSGHFYRSWRNRNNRLEDVQGQLTKVPPHVVVSLINDAVKLVCS